MAQRGEATNLPKLSKIPSSTWLLGHRFIPPGATLGGGVQANSLFDCTTLVNFFNLEDEVTHFFLLFYILEVVPGRSVFGIRCYLCKMTKAMLGVAAMSKNPI